MAVGWEQVRGHEAVIDAFRRALARGRLGHAYLFTGPPGVGKHHFARELAKALLCDTTRAAGGLDACDRCPSCRHFDAGSHPDFFAAVRRPEMLELPIDVIRELCAQLALKPARGGRKVAVLDDADDLNEASANCFLKTLEEPPPDSLLVLIGTTTERQLTTIVSRCQVVRFAPLPDDLVREMLQARGVTDPALLDRVIRLSGGSPGEALALAEPELWEFRGRLQESLSAARPDTVGVARAWMGFVEEAGKEAASQRRRAALVLRLLLGFLGQGLRASVGAVPEGLEPAERRAVEAMARHGSERLLRLTERCLEADRQIERKVQLVLVVEALADAFA